MMKNVVVESTPGSTSLKRFHHPNPKPLRSKQLKVDDFYYVASSCIDAAVV
jgi:hypothetical protein